MTTKIKKIKITKRFVDNVELPKNKKDHVFWDTELKGFGLRVRSSGSTLQKTYIIKYRDKNTGRQHKPIVGTYPPMPPEKARSEAMQQLASVQTGSNPAIEKKYNRNSITMKELADRFLREHVAVNNKPSTQQSYKSRIERVIIPQLGNLPVKAVSMDDITRLKMNMAKTPYDFNRACANLSKMFNLSEKWGMRPLGSNPCRFVTKYKENPRETFLTVEQVKKLFEYLDDEVLKRLESPYVASAIKLYLYTGCRASEVRTLKWEYIDYEKSTILYPDSKTGRKIVHLSKPAIDILKTIPRVEGNPYVIVGKVHGACLININKPWERIREAQGLPSVRLHDLRHTFASMVIKTHDIYTVGKLLGSKHEATRYAHLTKDSFDSAVNNVAVLIDS
jgi:integrase